jgi:hypothetical protein
VEAHAAAVTREVARWVRQNPAPWTVGFITQARDGRGFDEFTAGFCVFTADVFEDAGDCLVFRRADRHGHLVVVKAAVAEVFPAPGTLGLRYRNLQVAAEGFDPDVFVAVTKI